MCIFVIFMPYIIRPVAAGLQNSCGLSVIIDHINADAVSVRKSVIIHSGLIYLID